MPTNKGSKAEEQQKIKDRFPNVFKNIDKLKEKEAQNNGKDKS